MAEYSPDHDPLLHTGDTQELFDHVGEWAQGLAHDPALVPFVALAEQSVRLALANLVAIGDAALTAQIQTASVKVENAVGEAFSHVNVGDGGAGTRAAIAAASQALRAAIDAKAAEAISQLREE